MMFACQVQKKCQIILFVHILGDMKHSGEERKGDMQETTEAHVPVHVKVETIIQPKLEEEDEMEWRDVSGDAGKTEFDDPERVPIPDFSTMVDRNLRDDKSFEVWDLVSKNEMYACMGGS